MHLAPDMAQADYGPSVSSRNHANVIPQGGGSGF
jgi:hypothetical protein